MQPADAPADPTSTIEIGYSLAKMIGLTLGAAALTAASAAICVIAPDDVFALVVGVIGVLLFGLCTVMLVWRLRTEPVVLTLAPEGLRDVRVAQEFIPWEAIEDVSVFTMNGQSFVVLKVAPEVEARLRLTRVARWTRGPNRALGADGLCITAQGLKIGFDALLTAIVARVQAAALEG